MKIAVARFSSLGDCILLCPLLAHLKTSGADEVVVVTKRAYAELFAMASGVDRVVAIDAQTIPTALLHAGRELRAAGHVFIDAHASARSRLLSIGTGSAAARIRKHTRARLGLIVFKRPTVLPHMLERYAHLATGAGLPVPALAPGGIEIPADARLRASRALADTSTIAVAPGSRWTPKRWHGFAALCEGIARDGGRVLLVGDARDHAEVRPIVHALGERCVDLTGRTALADTAAHIARCRAFVGNDSGLMHLAEAVGVPVLALFGPTVQAFGYAPSLPASRTVERRLACRPCSRNGSTPCPKGTRECLERIHPDLVRRVLDSLCTASGERRVVLD